ncbi:hypothetical protein CEUSTIGMA_g203.t1 [Chlamydomonas eustigma]|uniref:Guanylate cyclase domain-containing protein n=1 Tax=Chlamydomonas eustigma TaxID=1157962 RepID=A0A250WPH9_9CHLO|nr:hypothetical protein CEUSTIGMA_g203.t1 [Chlamydomonas eustigma]|eukprot:GAX72747.1 hypothetical protein CEUSTIGMA_g203.t1 [Chlamydomonas eustigma]
MRFLSAIVSLILLSQLYLGINSSCLDKLSQYVEEQRLLADPNIKENVVEALNANKTCICSGAQFSISTFFTLVFNTPFYLDTVPWFESNFYGKYSLQPLSFFTPVTNVTSFLSWYNSTYLAWQLYYVIVGLDGAEQAYVSASGISIFTARISYILGKPYQPAESIVRGFLPVRTYLLTFFRKDVLLSRNVTAVPQTWNQLLSVLQSVNGTDMDGDGVEDWALCLDLQPPCKANAVLMGIASSIMQYLTVQQGTYFDPSSFFPLAGTAGMQEAMRIYSQLLGFATPGSFTACNGGNVEFLSGRCAVTLNWDMQFYSLNSTSQLAGNVGVAPLPGSEEVWIRSSNSLSKCTTDMCPLAQPLYLIPVNASSHQSGAGSAPPAPTSLSRQDQANASSSGAGSTLLVNQPGFSVFALDRINYGTTNCLPEQAGGGIMFVQEYRTTFETFLKQRMSSLDTTLGMLFSNLSNFNDVASNSSNLDLTYWTSNGYDKQDTLSYLGAVLNVYVNNQASDLVLPAAAVYRSVIETAAADLAFVTGRSSNRYGSNATVSPSSAAEGSSIVVISSYLQQQLLLVQQAYLNATSTPVCGYDCTRGQALRILQTSLNYTPPPLFPPSPLPPSQPIPIVEAEPAITPTAIIVTLVVCIVSGVVLLVGVAYWLYRSLANKSLGSKVVAPVAGPLTTILVTDVQNSTVLWESLPSEIMDRAYNVHHACIRRLLHKYRGYENLTEGDSFICTFHDPQSAVEFSVHCQKELLHLDWPIELLQHPDGCEVWMMYQPSLKQSILNGESSFFQSGGAVTAISVGSAPSKLAAPFNNIYGRFSRLYRSGSESDGSKAGVSPPVSYMSVVPPSSSSAAAPHQDSRGMRQLLSKLNRVPNVASRNGADMSTHDSSPQCSEVKNSKDRCSTQPRSQHFIATPVTAPAQFTCTEDLPQDMLPRGPADAPSHDGSKTGQRFKDPMHWLALLCPYGAYPNSSSRQSSKSASQRPLAASARNSVSSPSYDGRGSTNNSLSSAFQLQVTFEALTDILQDEGVSTSTSTIQGDTSAPPTWLAQLKRLWIKCEPSQQSEAVNAIAEVVRHHPSPFQQNKLWQGHGLHMPQNLSLIEVNSNRSIRAQHGISEDAIGEAETCGIALRQAKRTSSAGDALFCKTSVNMDLNKRILAFRGMRVRMGLHTGVFLPIIMDHSSGRARLPAPVLSAGKAVGDAAHGGQIIMSEQVYQALSSHKDFHLIHDRALIILMGSHILSGYPEPKTLRPSSASEIGNPPNVLKWDTVTQPTKNRKQQSQWFWKGDRKVSLRGGLDFGQRQERNNRCEDKEVSLSEDDIKCCDEEEAAKEDHSVPKKLFQLVPLACLSRLSLLPGDPALRTDLQLSPHALEAPLGNLTVAVLQVVGATVLSSELPATSEKALALFSKVTKRFLRELHGYPFYVGHGEVHAVFQRPESGLTWCLSCSSAMNQQAWPEELLNHDLGEELRVWVWGSDNTKHQRLIYRGLRLKAGCESGLLSSSLSSKSACVVYEGRPVSRALKMAHLARAGQVLSSSDCWGQARASMQRLKKRPSESSSPQQAKGYQSSPLLQHGDHTVSDQVLSADRGLGSRQGSGAQLGMIISQEQTTHRQLGTSMDSHTLAESMTAHEVDARLPGRDQQVTLVEVMWKESREMVNSIPETDPVVS